MLTQTEFDKIGNVVFDFISRQTNFDVRRINIWNGHPEQGIEFSVYKNTDQGLCDDEFNTLKEAVTTRLIGELPLCMADRGLPEQNHVLEIKKIAD